MVEERVLLKKIIKNHENSSKNFNNKKFLKKSLIYSLSNDIEEKLKFFKYIHRAYRIFIFKNLTSLLNRKVFC